MLKTTTPAEVNAMHFDPVDATARDQAKTILDDIKKNGLPALLENAVRLKDLETIESKLFYDREDLKRAYLAMEPEFQKVLDNTNARIKAFATAQRNSITDMTTAISGGEAGHFIAPVKIAGCYAPGGRYPLPSSVLMTVTTARAAGVETVWVVCIILSLS